MRVGKKTKISIFGIIVIIIGVIIKIIPIFLFFIKVILYFRHKVSFKIVIIAMVII